MTIPVSLIVAPALASFVVFILLYYRENSERRVLNPLFGLSVVAILLMFAAVATTLAGYAAICSPVLFALALAWLAGATVAWRRRPPAKKK